MNKLIELLCKIGIHKSEWVYKKEGRNMTVQPRCKRCDEALGAIGYIQPTRE